MKLDRVTITGADDSIKPSDLVKLTEKYSFVEWAILISAKQMGNSRFPSKEWMEEYCKLDLPTAAHVCGRWVKDIVSGEFPEELKGFGAGRLFTKAKRIQLNFHAEKMLFLDAFIGGLTPIIGLKSRSVGFSKSWLYAAFEKKQTIIQMDGVNNYVIQELLYNGANVVPLYDISHGAGILPETWPKPISGIYNGYAGGISPTNIAEQIKKIAEVAGDNNWWIDMETKVRSDNDHQFDLYKVEQCLDIAGRYING